MKNSSQRQGWLTPVNSDLSYDSLLNDAIHSWLTGGTGLKSEAVVCLNLSASLPEKENGCMFAVNKISASGMPVIVNQNDESALLERQEQLTCALYFYGPNAQLLSTQLRDGVSLTQNNSEQSAHFTVGVCSDIQFVTEWLSEDMTPCYQLTVQLNRKIIRQYDIRSLVDAPTQFLENK